MNTSDFDYILPEKLIAQMPADKRDNSRMLVLNRNQKTISHKHFYDITDYLCENDVLVLNNTKVLPARLYGQKIDTGAKIEILLLESSDTSKNQFQTWNVLIKPSKRIKQNSVIKVSEDLSIIPIRKLEDIGEWEVRLIFEGDLFGILRRVGNIPLPPYIERKNLSDELRRFDMDRYQTVYAKDERSVAAPTAGLHFTKKILQKLEKKGVEIIYVTLNVGLGTFRPVKCENILDHKMHSESFEITSQAADRINKAIELKKNIVAVGTTTVRTLETAYNIYGKIQACRNSSELFIYPPYKFNVVDKLITNFHLPKSTLLMLVSAFAGKDFIFEAYNNAVEKEYRFFSYGDCMFIE